jgi:hypothetical protein
VRAELVAVRDVDADTWPVLECFLAPPQRWLPLPATPIDAERYETTLRAGPLLQRVAIAVGEPWSVPDAVTRPIHWEPAHEDGSRAHAKALPGFTGRLTLRHVDREVTLHLEGTYVPPAGWLGAAADRLVMHRAGDATARALLNDVIERLCEHHAPV